MTVRGKPSAKPAAATPDAASAPAAAPYSRERMQRLAAGRAMREKLARSAHANPPDARRDALALLEESNRGRLDRLVPIRYGRMLHSPFAFMRGAAAVMAHDLSHLPDSGIVTQLCGDCHLNNFGGYASPERELLFGINGFDDMKRRLHRVEQSVVDLKRDEVETASELTDHRGVPDQLIARIELLKSRQPSS